jgi:hypothetical protein
MIMENIENFITAGDYLTNNAPESVGMAWYAIKLTLTAIHSNYELYNFFGSGLADISEIMVESSIHSLQPQCPNKTRSSSGTMIGCTTSGTNQAGRPVPWLRSCSKT